MKKIAALAIVVGTFFCGGVAFAGTVPNGLTFEHVETCDGTSQWFFTNPTDQTLTVNLSSVFANSVPEADDSDAGSLPVQVYPHQTTRNTYLYAFPSEYLLWLNGTLVERGPLTFNCGQAQPAVSETSAQTTTTAAAPITTTTTAPAPVVSPYAPERATIFRQILWLFFRINWF